MNPDHFQGKIIAGRYQIVTFLGEGGMGTTYSAIDLKNHQPVAIKIVSLRQSQDWKVLELFEREAKILANLDHPFIPNYLDYFQEDSDDDRTFYLVQELVEGESLAHLVRRGWKTTEEEVKAIATQILEILSYIHQLEPPIIHRDIKPQNIICRDDGSVYLVDFGAVKEVYNQTIIGKNTMIGTYGYIPLEQLEGKTYRASDLYSLGCTLVYILTHRSPADLPQNRFKIDFDRLNLNLSKPFQHWLEKMLEPDVKHRFQSAHEALKSLRSNVIESRTQSIPGSKVKISNTEDKLAIEIANFRRKNGIKSIAASWGCLLPVIFGLTLILFLIVYFYLIASWIPSLNFPSLYSLTFNLLIVSLLLTILLDMRRILWYYTGTTSLEINPKSFCLRQARFPNFKRIVTGATRNLKIVEHCNYQYCGIKYRGKTIYIDPTNVSLTTIEKKVIHEQIMNFGVRETKMFHLESDRNRY